MSLSGMETLQGQSILVRISVVFALLFALRLPIGMRVYVGTLGSGRVWHPCSTLQF